MMSVKKSLILTLLIAFLYELLLALQGFDLCDEGWVLSSYQQIFNAPSSVEYYFVYYLSAFIGGVWNSIFGFAGILGFRILTVLTLIGSIYFTYLTVKQYVTPIVIPIASSMLLLLLNFGIIVFDHTYLTALSTAMLLFFTLKGINSEKKYLIFIGGILCGITFFARIVNITLIALVFLFLVEFIYTKNKKTLWENITVFVGGILSGIAFIVSLMLIFGHFDIFVKSVKNLFLTGGDAAANHNVFLMLKLYVKQYIEIAVYLFGLFGATFFTNFIFKKIKINILKILLIIVYTAVIAIFFSHLSTTKYYAVLLLPIVFSFYRDRKSKGIILLNTASLIVMFCLPLGSDFGIENMGAWSIFLATFVAVIHICRFIGEAIKKKKNYAYFFLFISLYLVFAATNLYFLSRNAYFDCGSRLKKCYRADNSKFTVFTTQKKAVIIDDVLENLQKYVKKGDYLFCFESMPMLNYLTDTHPYAGNSWIWAYSPDNFKRHLIEAEETLPLPVCIEQKCQPIGGKWTEPDSTHITENTYLYNKERIEIFKNFIIKHRYAIVWENDLFRIYVAKTASLKE
ncbi:hypothetical protein FACS1894178_3620 [Bacteroidia bacterium]|nr:hypothetical protein FACS1894178_3620 [Bacteroidia bacterium]